MKLFKRGKHAYKHTPYKRGKHAKGGAFKQQSKLIFGKTSSVIEFSLATNVPEDIAGIPFFDEQNQASPEVLNALYNILNEGGVE